jgi:hypothetical protein
MQLIVEGKVAVLSIASMTIWPGSMFWVWVKFIFHAVTSSFFNEFLSNFALFKAFTAFVCTIIELLTLNKSIVYERELKD